jgi:hypothetical protein
MSNTAQRICVFGLAVFGAAGLAAAQSASTPIVFLQVRTSGMVGITEGQSARLNVLNPGVPPPLATAAICPAQLAFLNADGVVLKTATVSVLPGKSVFFSLDRDTELRVNDERVEIRATIQIPPVTPVATPPQPAVCRLIPTLEIFNNDAGRTQVVITRFVANPLPVTANP